MTRLHRTRQWALVAALLVNTSAIDAAPTAVNDSYSISDDALLSTGGGPLVSAAFDGAGNVIAGSWDYLDKIKNNRNGQTADTYPVDSAARDWKSLLFDKATSTVAGWQSAVPPLQGPAGGISAWPSVPLTLTGYSVGGDFNISTYLFRKAFTLDATTAAVATWTIRHIVDDAAIFYVNGVEVHRVQFDPATNYVPVGALTTNTVANITLGDETVYTTNIITLPTGLLVAGNNIFAIELHQGNSSGLWTSSDVGIDAQFTPTASSAAGGFVYLDDPFGSSNPNFAAGSVATTGGNPGGALLVELGRTNALNFSGGWRQTINLPAAGTVRFAFDWKVTARGGLEPDEFSRAILMVDGVYYGSQGAAPNFYLGQVVGNGSTDIVGPWTAATIDIPLTAGNHTVTFGGFCNKTTTAGEYTEALFDNVVITRLSGGNGVLVNDTGGAVSAQLVSNVSNGALNLLTDGNFSYQSNANFFGTDTFTYRALDAASAQSNVGTVTITVNAVNDPPVATGDSYSTNQQQTLSVETANGVLANDTDLDNTAGQLSALLVTAPQPSEGSLTLNANGSFTFAPAAAFVGTARFVYRTTDGTANSQDVSVNINVILVGNAPVAVNDAHTTAVNSPLTVTALVSGSTTEDIVPYGSAAVSSIWKYFDGGVDLGTAWRAPAYDDSTWESGGSELGYGNGDEVTIIDDNATSGYVNPDPGFPRYPVSYFRRAFTITNFYEVTAAEVTVRYDDAAVVYFDGTEMLRTSNMSSLPADPPFDYVSGSGSNNLEVTSNSGSNPLLLSLLDEGDNHIAAAVYQNAPTSSDVSFNLRLRLTRAQPAGLFANDTDADAGTTLTLSTHTQPANGTVSVNSNGTFTYTPNNGYIGPDSFTYRCTDGALLSNVATVNITVVTGPNVRPVANNDGYNATEETTLNVSAPGLLTNDSDADGDAMTAVLVTGPANGSLTLNPDGSFSYTPASNFAGSDSFTYTANDIGGPSAVKTVSITVANTNDAPVAVNETYSTDPGVTLVITAPGVLSNDTDVDPGAVLTAAVVTNPSSGSLTLNPSGSFNYAPAPGFTGTVTFTYRANDGTANSNTATVTIKINGRPVANANTYAATEDTTLNVNPPGLLGNDTDSENDPLTAILVTPPAQGTLSLGSNGGFTYTPAANYNGPVTFTYRANDGTRDSLTAATVTINIAAVNDAPIALPNSYGTPLDTPLSVAATNGVLANDSDVDGEPLTAVLETDVTLGSLSLSPNGSFFYTPDAGFTGIDSFTYRATDGTAFSSAVTVNLTVGIDLTKIVINEIHFHPPVPNAAAKEFVEVFNGNAGPVDVSGWRFDAGINYVMPSGTVIPGNGFLVTAADPVAFTAEFGSVPVLRGSWTGELSNSGERIRLRDSSGQTVDEVTYADEGDWARRHRVNISGQTSWEWYTRADADGSSAELVNPEMDNENGQNWLWSKANPTPGNPNSRAETDIAPLMWDLDHKPRIPRSTDPVTVTVNVRDEALNPPAVYCFWRVSVAAPGAFNTIQMLDNGLLGDGIAGDGEFGAVIPAQANDAVIEFYTAAVDAGNKSRTWPAPGLNIAQTEFIQECNAFYQVDEEVWSNNFPIYRLIGSASDGALFMGGWNRGSDAQINVTLVNRHGADDQVRYRSGLRVRGAGSRGNSINNWRLNIPSDDRWNGETEANLNVWHPHLGDLASKMMECAGLIHERSWPVQVRLNSTNRAEANSAFSGGYFIHLQPVGGEYLKEVRPNDSGGNIYNKTRGANSDWTMHEQSPGGPPNPSGYRGDGWTKQSNEDLDDWNDIHNLMKTFDVGTPTVAQMEAVMNLDYWLRWQAFQVIVNHNETNISNGASDDHGLYRGVLDPRFIPLAHDFDTVWGDGGNTSGLDPTSPTATIYQVNGLFSSGETIPSLQPLFSNPASNQRFKAQLVDLLNTAFLPANFDPMVDSTLGGWTGPTASYGVPVSKRTAIKNFNNSRRNHILQTVLGYTGNTSPAALTVTTSLGTVNGYSKTTVANQSGLSGTVDSSRVQKLRIGSVDISPNNFQSVGGGEGGNGPAPWSAGTAVSLTPGLNNLTIQALGPDDAVLHTSTVKIWYEDPSVEDVAAISGNTSLTLAGGPYRVTSSLTIDNETLSIEPGTTVYLAAGASLNVSGTGRILAEGTAVAPINFMREPGVTATWGRVNLNSSSVESRLAYVTIEGAGTSPAINLVNSTGYFDHITFTNVTVQYFSTANSSFVFQYSTFPATTGVDSTHGSGIPASGYAIFRGNIFGTTTGLNDIIDFTGGQRPNAILQVLENVFLGASDDVLELDGTDAHIEGNSFLNVHQQTPGSDTANAISGGRDGANTSEITIVRNLIYNCDHAILAKDGNFYTVVNNTIGNIHSTGSATGSTAAAFNFHEPARAGATPALGMLIDGNIVFDCTQVFENAASATGAITANRNIFPAPIAAPVTGGGNLTTDPMLASTSGITAANMAENLALRSGSPADCTGPNFLDRGAVVPAGTSISGEPIAIAPTQTALLTIGGPGITHYKYSLDGGPFGAETLVSSKVSLTGLAAGTHSIRAIGRNSAGVWQSETAATQSLTWTVAAGAQPIVINEVLASNVNAYPVGSLRPDYIELRNLSGSDVNIGGWGISDDAITSTRGAKYLFPTGTLVPAGGYLLLTTNTLGFNLDADGDEVFLYSGGSFGAVLIDTVKFGFQIADLSIGRTCNNLAWTLNSPTPAAANTAAETGTAALVSINEWSGNNDFIVEEDFVELYNGGSLPTALGGLSLTDDAINFPQQNIISPLSYIKPGGFVLFRADGNVNAGASNVSFSVSRLREGITLLSGSIVIDHIMSVPLIEDVTGGRASDGGRVFALFGPNGYSNLPTPGYSNATNLAPQQLLMENLRITELMYSPPGSSTVPEYMEWRNISATQTLDLSSVRLTDGITFQFALGTTLAPGAFICITQATQSAFAARWPGAPYGGTYSGNLSNGGEHLRVEIDGYELGILDFTFDDIWYPITDGGGASLEIVEAYTVRNTWDLKGSWRATTPNPGLNGTFGVIAGEDATICLPLSLSTEAVVTYGAQTPASVTFVWTKVSGPGTVNFTPANAAATRISFSDTGTYVLRFTATGTVSVSDEVTITAAERYDAWAERSLGTTDPLIAGELRDPDKDGLSNLIEYALGLSPASGSKTGMPAASAASGNLVLTYQRYTGCDLNYIVEVSSDLVSWSSNSVTEQMASSTGTLQYWTATETTPVSGASRRYVRVRVEKQ